MHSQISAEDISIIYFSRYCYTLKFVYILGPQYTVVHRPRVISRSCRSFPFAGV
jgi:hypothetical protein